jgi:hydrogenase expression/formation protein HypC
MCLAVPMQVKRIEGNFALVSTGGLTRKVNIEMVGNLKIGDYVMVHAGFAIEKVDPKKAKNTLRILDEIY